MKTRTYYIYKITFLKGRLKNKYYIGMHIGNNIDLLNDNYFGSGAVCKDYYQKYPPILGETINKDILEICSSKEELLAKEELYIGDLWKTDEMCVNLRKGGMGGGSPKGRKLSEATRKKISETLKKKEHNPNFCRKGPLSEETKQKISDSRKGKSSGMLGKNHTEETKRKISETTKKQRTKEKIAA